MTDPTINDLASRLDDLPDHELPEVAPVPKQIGRPFGKGSKNPRAKQVRVDGFNTLPRLPRGQQRNGEAVRQPPVLQHLVKPLKPLSKGK